MSLIGQIVATALILGACSPPAEETTAAPPTQSEPTAAVETSTEQPERRRTCSVSLLHSLDEIEVESLNSVAVAFQEIYPDFELNFFFAPEYDLRGKYENAVASGGGPSILYGAGEWGPPLFDEHLITDVSSFANDELISGINPAAFGSVQYSGAVIGLPMSTSGVLMFRNTNIIPEAPATFEDLLTKAQDAAVGDTVGAMLDYGLFYSAGHLSGIGGALMDEKGNPVFNNDKGVEWLEMIQRFEEAGPVENNNDNDINRFIENKAGIIIDSLGNAVRIEEAVGAENLVIDPWPSPMSGYVKTENLYLNANLSGDDLECAWSFIEFMLSPEAQEIFSDTSMANKIPAILDLDFIDPFKRQVMNAFSSGTTFPVLTEMAAYWDPVNNALLSVMEEGMDPAEALQDASDLVVIKLEEIHGE